MYVTTLAVLFSSKLQKNPLLCTMLNPNIATEIEQIDLIEMTGSDLN